MPSSSPLGTYINGKALDSLILEGGKVAHIVLRHSCSTASLSREQAEGPERREEKSSTSVSLRQEWRVKEEEFHQLKRDFLFTLLVVFLASQVLREDFIHVTNPSDIDVTCTGSRTY